MKSLSIPSSRSLFKWSQIAIQKSDLRVKSSPGRTQTQTDSCENVCSLHYVSHNTDAELDEGRTTLGEFVGNDLRLIPVHFPHFTSAGGADSLSPSQGTLFFWRQMKVTFLAFDY